MKRLSVVMLAFRGKERIQQVLSVAGNASDEQFAIRVMTHTGESCGTIGSNSTNFIVLK